MSACQPSHAAPCSTARRSLLAAWVLRYGAPLRRFFRKRGRRDYEDLVQEVFERLISRPDLATIREPEAFVLTIAGNVLIDRRRREDTRCVDLHEPLSEESEALAIIPSPERVIGGQQDLQRLIDAIQALPERTRAVFVLYHLEAMPHIQIGRQVGMAVSTVEKHLARANVQLLHRLQRR